MAKFHATAITDFDENYDSEGESIFSSVSCLSNDKETHGSAGDIEPFSPVLVNTEDHRPRVSSVDNSVHSASPSINTFKVISSPVISGESPSTMTVLSKSCKSPKREPMEANSEIGSVAENKMGWDFSRLKISKEQDPPKFSLNDDNREVLSRAHSKPLRSKDEGNISFNYQDMDQKSKYTGRCKAWYTEKGFGFVHCNEDKKDYFCHFSSIAKRGFRSLEEGDMVGFDLCDNVRKAGSKMCANVVNL